MERGNGLKRIAESQNSPGMHSALQMRKEQEVFDDLATLCGSPGYVHAIAHFSFRDNVVPYVGEMKPEDMQHLFSYTRLIRTEQSILKGLLIKQEIDYTLPSPKVLQEYLAKTESLLEELPVAYLICL
jgi:hypothetical protein